MIISEIEDQKMRQKKAKISNPSDKPGKRDGTKAKKTQQEMERRDMKTDSRKLIRQTGDTGEHRKRVRNQTKGGN